MLKQNVYVECFSQLGNDCDLPDSIEKTPEAYVCMLFGSKIKSVDDTRFEMFIKKHSNQNKIIDLCVLPPCYSSLILHMRRANFEAAMWKRSDQSIIEFPEILDHGWNIDGSIDWIVEALPDDFTEMVFEDDNENDIYESDIDSDIEDFDDDDY